MGLLLTLCAVGCGASNSAADIESPWVGDISTENGLTTVYNRSGSVWGGAATVVEEVSIGVDSGPEELMFGSIAWVYENDGTIYAVDPQAPAVRTFDLEGNYLGTIGAPGQGPGEYTDPFRVVAAPDGRIFVSEPRQSRINVFAADGSRLETWTAQMNGQLALTMVVDDSGVLWVPVALGGEGETAISQGLRAMRDGEPAESVLIETIDGQPPPGGGRQITWTPAGPGRIIVGYSNSLVYRFEVQQDGQPVLSVERAWQPEPVDREFISWYLLVYGSERSATYPAYVGFAAAASGEIWVARPGPVRRVADCEADLTNLEAARANPCWRPTFLADVFGADGRYLGPVDLPDDVLPVAQRLHIDGDRVLAVSVDEQGVSRVKRFRLVLPH